MLWPLLLRALIMRYLYSAIYYLLMPLVLLRMLWRSRRAPAYRRRLGERFGFFRALPDDGRDVLWVHAVSVGETLAAAPLLEELMVSYPQHQLVVTTTTPTGSERVEALFGERVFHVYAPWDLPGAVARFFSRTRPALLLLMETELWPNMLHRANRRGVPVILANGRMSERSAKGYGRLPGLSRQMLSSLAGLACQSAEDARRFIELGAPVNHTLVSGSIKFDVTLDQKLVDAAATLRRQWRADQRPVIVAASTHPGEDELILDAFAELRSQVKDCLLLLVPRHPERFAAVARLSADRGWQVLLRSQNRPPGAQDDVVIGDTMGELLLLLSVGRVAVIGGSLVPHGGHNVLEASAWGVPVVTGPHMFNFDRISSLMTSAGAMVQLKNEQQLAPTLLALLLDDNRLSAMGEAGKEVLAQNRGARQQLLNLVAELLPAR